jgi:chromosome segregation ATPase
VLRACGQKQRLLFGIEFHHELRRPEVVFEGPGEAREKVVMNESEFQTKLAELMGEITTLPQTERKKLEKLANETRERHERLRQTVSSLQESLDYLRLSIKYLVFDLEATRRENTYLRKMLEETTGNE